MRICNEVTGSSILNNSSLILNIIHITQNSRLSLSLLSQMICIPHCYEVMFFSVCPLRLDFQIITFECFQKIFLGIQYQHTCKHTYLENPYDSRNVQFQLCVQMYVSLSHLKLQIVKFQLQNRDSSVSRTEKGCRAKTNINTAMLKDVWLMLSFLMDVLTILGDINKAFQEKTAVISSVLFEIKSAVRNLERLRYRYIYICSITKNVRSHVQAVLFFAT